MISLNTTIVLLEIAWLKVGPSFTSCINSTNHTSTRLHAIFFSSTLHHSIATISLLLSPPVVIITIPLTLLKNSRPITLLSSRLLQAEEWMLTDAIISFGQYLVEVAVECQVQRAGDEEGQPGVGGTEVSRGQDQGGRRVHSEVGFVYYLAHGDGPGAHWEEREDQVEHPFEFGVLEKVERQQLESAEDEAAEFVAEFVVGEHCRDYHRQRYLREVKYNHTHREYEAPRHCQPDTAHTKDMHTAQEREGDENGAKYREDGLEAEVA